MKKRLFLVVTIFIVFSCEQYHNNGGAENTGSFKIAEVKAKELLAPSYGDNDPSLKTAAEGANDFAFRLNAVLVKNNAGKNFVCSPFSVWMPLAALVNAADSQFKDALLTSLGASGISPDDVNKTASRMLYDLTKLRDIEEEGYYNPLKIVNAIFVDNKVTLRKDFAQAFMDFYRGSSINVDFASPDAVDAVNNWASKNTGGLITNLVEKFNPLTFAAIANAIYYSDRWRLEFNPDETKDDVFHAPVGDRTVPFMLRRGGGQIYYEDEKIQAVPLGFLHNGGLYILLPKSGGIDELVFSMTNDYFNEIQRNSVLAEGRLLLPRFLIENKTEGLQEALESLGVPLFEGETITGLITENIPLSLTDAMQKAVIKVDEKGTTAAAVTVLENGATSTGPQPEIPFEMVCDRPFMFILYDYTYDGRSQVLFTGVVNQP
ncbi:MAG: hypothetical protein FWH38_04705 [Treponema sp.]|nr:hypothetical protein [Treponema sp.]